MFGLISKIAMLTYPGTGFKDQFFRGVPWSLPIKGKLEGLKGWLEEWRPSKMQGEGVLRGRSDPQDSRLFQFCRWRINDFRFPAHQNVSFSNVTRFAGAQTHVFFPQCFQAHRSWKWFVLQYFPNPRPPTSNKITRNIACTISSC